MPVVLSLLHLPVSLHIDARLAIAGALVGLLVGLTGMGGGALLTPLLVLVFRVSPLAAVSSDLVTSLVMKPFGAAVHAKRGTIHKPLLAWLCLGSIPTAFLGAVVIGRYGHAASVQTALRTIIGVVLLGSVAGTITRMVVERRRAADDGPVELSSVPVRPLLTLLIGAVGGLAVGLTSVGAGSLIIALLLLAYPRLRPQQLVGTDIAQAIPLVGAAALGHLLFGDVRLGVTASLLLGAIPLVMLGARLSASAPARVVRPLMTAVLAASAMALLHTPTTALLVVTLAVAAAVVVCQLGRRAHRPVVVSLDA